MSREPDHFELIRLIGIGDEIGERIGFLRSGIRVVHLPDVFEPRGCAKHRPSGRIRTLSRAVAHNRHLRMNGSNQFWCDPFELAVDVDVISAYSSNQIIWAHQITVEMSFEVGQIEHAKFAKYEDDADRLIVFDVALDHSSLGFAP